MDILGLYISGFAFGIIGFVCVFVFDLNNASHNNDHMESLYGLGGGFFGIGLLLECPNYTIALPIAVRILMGVLALFFLYGIIFCTYILGKRTRWGKAEREQGKKNRWWQRPLVDTGLYALCRHPAVWCMIFFLLCLRCATGFPVSYTIIYILLTVVLSFTEDAFIFPKTIPGFDRYQQTTPLYFPNRESVRRCKATWNDHKKSTKKRK